MVLPWSLGGLWSQAGSVAAGAMFFNAMFRQYFPESLERYIVHKVNRVMGLTNPYVEITFPEYTDIFHRSVVYSAIQNYLSTISSAGEAKRLKAHDLSKSRKLVLTMDFGEEITDEFGGAKVWWTSYCTVVKKASRGTDPERKFFKLTFHAKDKDLVTGGYMDHIVAQGKAIAAKNRKKKLYTNTNDDDYTMWTSVVFEHPASFGTLAIDSKKKQEIMDDLVKFQQGKDYYAKIGKAWKRGYLLYGPPGTGKSTMIAAMANFLDYNVYDLELTAVKDNTDLRKLLIDTNSKSIIVIEDIDCSLNLTGQRKEAKKKENSGSDYDSDSDSATKKKNGKVTLSGLLNFIDGIWSACGGERVIVFTTNHVDKLDPALIRRGRMDKHIELSYCCFEAFKVLANNYLGIESHESFSEIESLLGEVDMTPADVAENLLPKSDGEGEDSDMILKNLIKVLQKLKQKQNEKKVKSDNPEKADEKVDSKDSSRRRRRFSRLFRWT